MQDPELAQITLGGLQAGAVWFCSYRWSSLAAPYPTREMYRHLISLLRTLVSDRHTLSHTLSHTLF
jgi:hypothetical protein